MTRSAGTTESTATPFDFGSGSVVTWSFEHTIPGAAGAFSSYSPTTNMAIYDSPIPVSISNDSNNDIAGYTPAFFGFDPGFVFLYLSINGNTPPEPATITGSGVPMDYSGWDASVISYFESFTQADPLVLTSDETTSNLLAYVVTAVPEARAWLLVGVVVAGACLAGRFRSTQARVVR